MDQAWIRDYILLALRIDRAFRRLDDWPFIDHFYGPQDLKELVENEPEMSVSELTRSVMALADSLPSQRFERQRASYLERHLRAMEAFCRKLSGQNQPLVEEIQQCLDILPVWQSESEFKQALRLLDAALPGRGNLRERYRAWREQTTLPPEKFGLILPLMQQILAEVRRRTQSLVELPEGEDIEVCTVRGKTYGAANWYLGNYRSRIELNIDRPVNLFSLLYQMSHEGYPGHHTEFALKEKHLFLEQGYLEQSVFIMGPQLVIAEGIAELALEMIFTPDETADWAHEYIYPILNIEAGEVDLPKLMRAFAAISLDDLSGNLVMMLRNGHSEEAVVEYALEYTPHSEAQIRGLIHSLKSPLDQIYAFTYSHGKQLMRPLLQGDSRAQVFRRFLTEPVYPAMLIEWARDRGKE